MTDSPSTRTAGRQALASWLLVAGYFVVFFTAMTLGGILFLLGGIGLVLIPGSMPVWASAAYIVCGIIGSVVIAILVANGAFRLARARSAPPATSGSAPTSRALGWVAGVVGTVVASVLSAVLGSVILAWLDR